MSRNIGNRTQLSLDAGGPSEVLLAYQEASDSATLDFDNVFNNDQFNMYKVVISAMIPATDGAALYLRVGTGSPTVVYDTASNYRVSSLSKTYVVASAGGVGNAAGESACGVFHIMNPMDSSLKTHVSISTMCSLDSGDFSGTEGYDLHNTAVAVNSFQLLCSTGNITSGSVWVYGLSQTDIV